VSLSQTGTVVSGRYHDWGVTYANPEQAGTLTGTVSGSAFTGTFQDNAKDVTGGISWTLVNGQIQGTYDYGGASQYPWCGVAAGQGTPLPKGCGWSDFFTVQPLAPVFLTQVADEVTGSDYYGAMAGIVSDYRLNGGLDPSARFSFWMTKDGTQFSGNLYNPYIGAWYGPWCGARGTLPLPTACTGGGGTFDGTWFTNLGILTLTQPLLIGAQATPSTTVTGSWMPWGGDPASAVEYPINGTVTLNSSMPWKTLPSEMTLTWTDSSPLGGATFGGRTADNYGVSLAGEAANGVPWCGVDYGPNPFVAEPYAADAGPSYPWLTEPIGSLYPGCGLTSDVWTLWPPSPGGVGSPQASGQLVETRDHFAGTTDLAGLNRVAGTVVFSPPDGGDAGTWIVASGSWANSADGGSLTWFLDEQEQTFSGDFTFEDGGNPLAWCGSAVGSTMPNPCLQ
jgi:hypothetical protein